MKTLLSILSASILCVAPLSAQEEEPMANYYYVHFMSVASEDSAAHLETEQNYVTQIHKERKSNGTIVSWDMLSLIHI